MSIVTEPVVGPDAPAPPRDQPVARRPLKRRLASWRSRGGLAAIVFALPAVLVYLYFAWGPIVSGFVMSLQSTNLVSDPTWVGWENFAYVLSDPLLPQAVLNTVYFTVLALLFGFPLPLFLAVAISELRRFRGLYSTLAYLPVVVPPVVAILLWKTFYDPGASGLFNQLLGSIGLGPWPWLNSTATAMPSIVLEATWAGAGSTVIIYLAALTSVNTDLYEAAELDGAGIWRRVWNITIPQLRGVILVMLLLQIIGTMQLFTEPYLFTGGGPENATMTVLLVIFDYAFVQGDYGAATALSFLLALALGVVSYGYHLATRNWRSS